MSDYITTIGIEIHAELATKSKMFCGCKNDPNEKRPNVNVCPVCTAQPGALPVINKEAVRQMIRIGNAVGGNIADFTEFDRKNYFYPDLPKGYQISQYKYPIVSGGTLHGVELTRIHLEEDTARSQHSGKGEDSIIDFNRSSVPLMELVTEPVVHSAKDAADFARELQLLLRYLGASEANMEKGQMRVEANISVSKDPNKFGTKVEVKNLNSFRSVERAVEYEVKRQSALIDDGGQVVQETRGWNDAKQETYSQRKKEDSHDYRYFPEPDLPKLYLNRIEEFKNLRETLPELPWEKRERLHEKFGFPDFVTEVFVQNVALGKFFEEVLAADAQDSPFAKLAANYLSSDLISLIKLKAGGEVSDLDSYIMSMPMKASEFATLVKMLQAGELSSRGAKDVLAQLFEKGGDPKALAESLGVVQKSDAGALEKIVDEVIAANIKVFEEYKAGKEASLQFLIGQGMKASKGSANPGVLKELFMNKIKS
ncbi:MAG: Asp-tRNA(Asn)/Glu-tRNA(Gln) amidotransferase subunit GatB [Candidatus Paceibacterota bacterium]|jgi:aspartyl-tRNA(Asn)/glutamyl-tRNA(Gln) amidotransferase subunit B